jgi:hypothetical protein
MLLWRDEIVAAVEHLSRAVKNLESELKLQKEEKQALSYNRAR